LIAFHELLFIKSPMKHGGKRRGAGRKKGSRNPNAGRKPGSLNRLTLRLAAEQRRTREARPKMLQRVLNQCRIRKHQLTPCELIRIAKEAAPHFAKPMGYVKVHCVNGRFVPVDRGSEVEAPLALAMDAAELN
jgi:hypothetical protein